jgi:hypothetical protein
MGNKLPERIESQMVDFEKFLGDVSYLNSLFEYHALYSYPPIEIRDTRGR